ncbi:unnamed protein product [Linum trigynum]|uniref:Uncharacterized protein n=1 Tax=Linum trigynum TaxID=586398 RepID=A0AAV2EUL1_9ROSI
MLRRGNMTTNLKLTESASSTETDGEAVPASAMQSSVLGTTERKRHRVDGEVAVLGCHVAVRRSECAGVGENIDCRLGIQLAARLVMVRAGGWVRQAGSETAREGRGITNY